MKYSHAYQMAFTVYTDNKNPEDNTEEQLMTALVKRVREIKSLGEINEACGCYDTDEA